MSINVQPYVVLESVFIVKLVMYLNNQTNSREKPVNVTVYITNHNYGDYIKESIESVFAQQYTDFELLIIDDGSTDNSRQIIEKYKTDERVSVIYQENKGLNVTNNIALKAARGKYLIRLDADDYFDPNALLILASYLDKHPDVSLVFPDYYNVDSDGEILSLERRHNFQEDVSLKDQPAHGACSMIRRDCLQEVGGYWEDFRCQDGYDLWLKIFRRYRVVNLNTPLFYYRQHGRSLTDNESQLLETRHRIIQRNLDSNEAEEWRTGAILPIRGSAGNENIVLKPFCGTTLLDIAVQEVLGADKVDRVILTTPDIGIIDYVGERYPNVTCDTRPIELAKLNTHLEDTVRYLLESYPEILDSCQAIMLLQVQAPFRNSFYLDKAINSLKLFDTDSLVAVRMEQGVLYRHQGHGLEPINQNERLRLERDFLYRRVGGLQVFRKTFFEQHGCMIGGRVGHVLLDELAGLTIESQLDWEIAELLYRQRKSYSHHNSAEL